MNTTSHADVDLPQVTTPDLATMLRPLLLRVTRNMRSQRADASITLGELSALHTLRVAGPMTPRDLAAREAVRPPTMTKVIIRLEQLGLLKRDNDPHDRRFSLLSITPSGSELVESENRSRSTWLTQRLSTLTEQERIVLLLAVPVLRKIADF